MMSLVSILYARKWYYHYCRRHHEIVRYSMQKISLFLMLQKKSFIFFFSADLRNALILANEHLKSGLF